MDNFEKAMDAGFLSVNERLLEIRKLLKKLISEKKYGAGKSAMSCGCSEEYDG